MSLSLRHPEILAIARRRGRVEVDDLAARLEVTPQTVRRDLAELSAAGRLTRVHGGAVWPSGVDNIEWRDRRALAAGAKAAIARAAAARIEPGMSVFLSIGTTAEAVAEALAGTEPLLAVTSNLTIARVLGEGGAEVRVTGGRLRAADGALVGAEAADAAARFRPNWAVLGCSGIAGDGALLDYDPEEVAVMRAAMGAARRRMLVADASKLERAAPVVAGTLGELDLWVTDAPPPAPLAALCRHAGTEVVVAG